MKGSDITAIAGALYDKYANLDPTGLRFTDRHDWVVTPEGFGDDHKRGGEKILGAIQQAWIDEAQ